MSYYVALSSSACVQELPETKIPLLLRAYSHHSHSSSCCCQESSNKDSSCDIMLLCQVQHLSRSCLKPRFLSFFKRILITLILQAVTAMRVQIGIQVVMLCCSVKFSICRGVAETKIPLLLQAFSHHSHSSSCRFHESPNRESGCDIMLVVV